MARNELGNGDGTGADSWKPKKPPFETAELIRRLRQVMGKLDGERSLETLDSACQLLFGENYSGGKRPGGELTVADPGVLMMNSWRQAPPRNIPAIREAADKLRRAGRMSVDLFNEVESLLSTARVKDAQQAIRLSSCNPDHTFSRSNKAEALKLASEMLAMNRPAGRGAQRT